MKNLSCKQAREIDLVEYLVGLGHKPAKIRASDYWFLSPLREERTASFKVNQSKNAWFDFGEGVGGDIIDFGTKYFKCSVGDFLERLTQNKGLDFSFHPHSMAGEKKDAKSSRIVIVKDSPLQHSALLKYLAERCIPLEIANRYCREVTFQVHNKTYFAIGFQNDKGGFELRNKTFKGSSSPKSTTYFQHNSSNLSVFEGFFDFLSFHTLKTNLQGKDNNFLVLNSLSFFTLSKELMDKHQAVNLYLDRNKKGIEFTQRAVEWNKEKYKDRSIMLRQGQDLNEYLIEQRLKAQQKLITKVRSEQRSKGRKM